MRRTTQTRRIEMNRSEDIANRAIEGDNRATRELFQTVYQDLRRVAGAKLAGEAPGQTLTATALVHEAFLKLGPESQWNDKTHLFRTAAKVMRQILIDAARRKETSKHGGSHNHQELFPDDAIARTSKIDPAEFDEAVQKLDAVNPLACAVLELRHYGGQTWEEIAAELSVSVEKVESLWKYARAKLIQSLTPPTA
jgi:RNA polymerase sigma factor (TIGR02999 family)